MSLSRNIQSTTEHWTQLVFVFSVRLEHVGSALLDIHYSVTLNILQYSALVDNTVLFVG